MIEKTQLKICNHCEKKKTVSDFYKVKNGKHGVMGTCKQCISDKRKEKLQQKHQSKYLS